MIERQRIDDSWGYKHRWYAVSLYIWWPEERSGMSFCNCLMSFYDCLITCVGAQQTNACSNLIMKIVDEIRWIFSRLTLETLKQGHLASFFALFLFIFEHTSVNLRSYFNFKLKSTLNGSIFAKSLWQKLKIFQKQLSCVETLNSFKIGLYKKPKVKFQPSIKEILFTLLFFVSEMKWNFVSGAVREKWLIQLKRFILVLMKKNTFADVSFCMISFRVVLTWHFIARNEISFLLKWPKWNNTHNEFHFGYYQLNSSKKLTRHRNENASFGPKRNLL